MKISYLPIYTFFVFNNLMGIAWAQDHSDLNLAERYQKDGIIVSIRQAEVTRLSVPEGQTSPSWNTPSKVKPEAISALAMIVDLINNSKTRKLDLSQEFQVELADDFGNSYRILDPPENVQNTIIFPNKHFPSLYPGEIFSKKFFFEAPVARSKDYYLTVHTGHLGMDEKIRLRLPQAKVHVAAKQPAERKPKEGDLQISIPANGTSVLPGESLTVEIKMAKDLSFPNRIYVMSSEYLLEDRQPAYRYKVRIPKALEPGPYTVVVMALWNKESEDLILSRSVTLDIVDLKKRCLQDCLQDNMP